MTKLLGLLFIASTTLTACTSSEDEFADAAAEVEGIYKISSYTHNSSACAPGGESILGSDRFAVAISQEVFGHTMLSLMSCASPQDCRQKVAAIESGGGFGLDFSFTANELDGSVLLGRGASSGSLEDGRCIGGAKIDTKFKRAGAALTIQQEITPANAYAPEDGICWTEAARKSAAGSCVAMEQLAADFVEAL